MLLHKNSHSYSRIPLCLKEDEDFFKKEYHLGNQPYQFIPIHHGSCSENYIFKSKDFSCFIKKPHVEVQKTIQIITENLTFAHQAKILAPHILAETPHHALIMELMPGHSVASNKITEKHLEQLWNEYKKYKTIPIKKITNPPAQILKEVYVFCFSGLTHLPHLSFGRAFLFRIIYNVMMTFPKSEIIHNPQKLQAIHWDFHNNNVLFNQGKLSGIIDWEQLTLGYASEDWVRYMFCLIERLPNYYQRHKQTKKILKFLLSQNAFSKEEWALGLDKFFLKKIRKILIAKKLSFFRLLKTALFSIFWLKEKEWILKQVKSENKEKKS